MPTASTGTPAVSVAEVMTRAVITVAMDESLIKVRDLFNSHRFHHLLVLEKGKLVGVVSDRDLLKNLSPFLDKMAERDQDLATLNRRVHQVMSRRPVTVRESAFLADAVRLMLDRGVSCLPVVDSGRQPVGIVTWRDLLRGLSGLR